MIFPGASLGKLGGKQNVVGAGDCPNFLGDVILQLTGQLGCAADAVFESDECSDGLAFNLMGAPNHGGFGDAWMVDQSRLHFHRC